MNLRPEIVIAFLATAASLIPSAAIAAEPVLKATVASTAVSIAPRPASRKSISLPDLELPFQIVATCPDDSLSSSISISVADTVQSHDVSTQSAESAGIVLLETDLLISSRQLAPITVGQFCVDDENAPTGNQTLQMAAAITASISLRCTTADSQSMVYESIPLQIELTCSPLDNEQLASEQPALE